MIVRSRGTRSCDFGRRRDDTSLDGPIAGSASAWNDTWVDVRAFWSHDRGAVDLRALAMSVGPDAEAFQQSHEWRCEYELLRAMGRVKEVRDHTEDWRDEHRFVSRDAANIFMDMFRASDIERIVKRRDRRAAALRTASVDEKVALILSDLTNLQTIRECENERDARAAIGEMSVPFDKTTESSDSDL